MRLVGWLIGWFPETPSLTRNSPFPPTPFPPTAYFLPCCNPSYTHDRPPDVCFNSNFDGCDGGQISTPWSYIKSKGVVTGGQYKGSGPFGAGYCSDFSLPHCHHHGPQGSDPYPAEGKPGCESQSSPDGPKKCDSAATGSHSNFADDKYSFDGKIQSASGEKAIQQAIMLGGPMETAFTVYSDFEDYDGGIYHHVTGRYGC